MGIVLFYLYDSVFFNHGLGSRKMNIKICYKISEDKDNYSSFGSAPGIVP